MNAPVRLGPYELLFPLAQGGMATVHLARRRGAEGFERLVAIKRIHPHLSSDPDFRAMLIDEARLSSMVHHPGVVSTLDVIETDGELALVLDYVEGATLSQLARAGRAAGEPLSEQVVSRIASDLLSALQAAHDAHDLAGKALHIVHRDVSPQNVLVGADGHARLIDFGVAKAAERIAVTQSGVLKGKLRYMSPEQARRKPLDRRSDVFAAGAVLYEGLTGSSPFDAETEASILLAVVACDFAPPTRPDGTPYPAEIVSVLERAMAVDPDDRFATAADFEDALKAAIPPASAGEVALLVTRVAGPTLTARREKLQALASRPSPSPTPPATSTHSGARRIVPWAIAGACLSIAVGAVAVAASASAPTKAPSGPPSASPTEPPAPSAPSSDEAPATASPPPSSPAPDPSPHTPPPKSAAPKHGPPVPRPVLHKNPYQ